MSKEAWNRCDVCGRFIAIDDFRPVGKATREMVLPDSDYTCETYETLCENHTRITEATP